MTRRPAKWTRRTEVYDVESEQHEWSADLGCKLRCRFEFIFKFESKFGRTRTFWSTANQRATRRWRQQSTEPKLDGEIGSACTVLLLLPVASPPPKWQSQSIADAGFSAPGWPCTKGTGETKKFLGAGAARSASGPNSPASARPTSTSTSSFLGASERHSPLIMSSASLLELEHNWPPLSFPISHFSSSLDVFSSLSSQLSNPVHSTRVGPQFYRLLGSDLRSLGTPTSSASAPNVLRALRDIACAHKMRHTMQPNMDGC